MTTNIPMNNEILDSYFTAWVISSRNVSDKIFLDYLSARTLAEDKADTIYRECGPNVSTKYEAAKISMHTALSYMMSQMAQTNGSCEFCDLFGCEPDEFESIEFTMDAGAVFKYDQDGEKEEIEEETDICFDRISREDFDLLVAMYHLFKGIFPGQHLKKQMEIWDAHN